MNAALPAEAGAAGPPGTAAWVLLLTLLLPVGVQQRRRRLCGGCQLQQLLQKDLRPEALHSLLLQAALVLG